MQYCGIDFGSKLAGTTVIAYTVDGDIHFQSSVKKQDADQMILQWAQTNQPKDVFVDAPLSLPGVYRFPDQFSNYFYREADRALSAMSPMFLGGLTARAMKLKAQLQKMDISVQEVYPGGLRRILDLDSQKYKKEKTFISTITDEIMNNLSGFSLTQNLPDWHHVDALLALTSAYRFSQGNAQLVGLAEEGQIIL